MLPIFAIFVLTILAGCLVAAAWPLVLSRPVRPVLVGATGSCCVAGGASLVALLVSGLLPLGLFTPAAYAQGAAAANTPAAASSAPGSAAPLPSPDPEPPSSADPVIEAPPAGVVIPPGRPEWTGAEPDFTDSIHTIPVSSGPYHRRSDADRALDENLVQATQEYIGEQLGSKLAATFITYDAQHIKARFVKPANTYHDVANYSIGPMHENFALIEFGPEFRQEINHSWRHFRGESRLWQLGLFAGAGLLLIGSVFGYFRMDNATRGYYTGRLQFMAAAAILGVVGGGVLLARWIHWL